MSLRLKEGDIMVVWKMRNCPRCGGDIFLDTDGTLFFDHCLQCGYIRRRSKECCPKCGDDMFLNTVTGNRFYRCHQCGYLSRDKHVSISQKYQHTTCIVTSSDVLATDWRTRKTMDRQPGRPKGSKDKKKRRQRRSGVNQS